MAIQRIAFLLVDGFALLSTAAALEPLRAANLFAPGLYETRILSPRSSCARASVGAWFEATPLAEAGFEDDLVFVVAGGDPLAVAEPEAAAWLAGAAAAGARLGGISGGAAVLAQAGLMKNRRFTIHWHHFDELRALSDAYLMERRLFVIDRDRYSCAGGSAPLDMMHAIISRDHGVAFARRISNWFIQTEVRVSETPQRAGLAARHEALSPPVAAALELMETHIADPLTLEQLSELAGLSARQLQRQFGEALGASVMEAYRNARLDVARDLVVRSKLRFDEIAAATGFSSAAHFAQSFGRRFAQSPSAARKGGA